LHHDVVAIRDLTITPQRSTPITSRDLSDEPRLLPVGQSSIRRRGTAAARYFRFRAKDGIATGNRKLFKTAVSHTDPLQRLGSCLAAQ